MSVKPMVRIATAGSVDDGKSTLIGRIMLNSQAIMEDHLRSATTTSESGSSIDLARFTDGLKSEREQGITIDVAYKYFSTEHRKFILADTPGHEQYTRNMATGASTADAVIILIDAEKGVTTQTRRHTAISSLLNIPRILFTVNKMDIVGYGEDQFLKISEDISTLARQLKLKNWQTIPISARDDVNITKSATEQSWFDGPPLMEVIDQILPREEPKSGLKYSVQYVTKTPDKRRGLAGKVFSDSIGVGDRIKIYPGFQEATVAEAYQADTHVDRLTEGEVGTIVLDREIDCDRGSVLIPEDSEESPPPVFWESTVIWFSQEPLRKNQRYILRHRESEIGTSVVAIDGKLDLNDFSRKAGNDLELNDIGHLRLELHKPLFATSFESSRSFGSFILIDPKSNETVGAGFFTAPVDEHQTQVDSTTWHYSEDEAYLKKIKQSNVGNALLLLQSRGLPEESSLNWWLEHLAEQKFTVLTNIPRLLDFKSPQINWSKATSERDPGEVQKGGGI
ncbi:MAG: GTP-binding protein [Pseudobacteriovorax sp.]|nr:GTP-binding protein [Pseudobacteriovorax sp.]